MLSRRLTNAGCAVLVVCLFVAAVPVFGEPLLSEKMLPADSLAVFIVRDTDAMRQRWRLTALYAVLQDPEMKQMLAPLVESVKKLYTAADQVTPVPLASLDTLLTGELGFAVLTANTEKGPQPIVQLLLRPKNLQQTRDTVTAFMQALVQMGAVKEELGKTDETTIWRIDNDAFLMVTFTNGVGLLTFFTLGGEGIHAATLARRADPMGGLANDPGYQAAMKNFPDDPDMWFYLGLASWIQKNPALAGPVQMATMSVGVPGLKSVAAGIKIEGRGFRTRAFVEIFPQNMGTAGHVITRGDLRRVPRDVLSFGMGQVHLPALYDRVMQLMMINTSPRGQSPMEGIKKLEKTLGLSIRDDILGIPSDRYLYFVSEPASPAGSGAAIFLSVKNKTDAAQKLDRALGAISSAIQKEVGPNGSAFVRTRKIDRGQFIQIYPQSVLPGAITPTVTVMDAWMCVGLSAHNVLRRTEHFLNHKESVLGRADFMDILAKLPAEYTTISYTDVGRCFNDALLVIQMLTDIGIAGLKVAAQSGEAPLPVNIAEIWGMDPGRYPNPEIFRKNLFGAVSVIVRKENGYLYENFSPLGPLPVPSQSMGAGMSNRIATTSILAGMLLPALARARGEARKAVSRSNMKQITLGMWTYMEPNADKLPPSLADLFPAYIDNPQVLVAPWDKNPFIIKNNLKCSYRYIGTIPFRVVGPSQFVLYERISRTGGRNVAHFDGHIKYYREREFRRILARQYEEFKKFMQKPNFPGDKARVKAFFEDKNFPVK